ncbi:MAG: phosphotransferase family protein, partial [Lachnospiraceae bacterium]|nr:phosphotransferase family protein [Lachnospiraceae bacterium]
EPQATIIRDKLKTFDKDKRYEKSFWEEVLIDTDRMIVYAKVAHSSDTVEINTFEQLRELDENSNNLKSDAIEIIAVALQVNKNEIVDINILKKGMTNRSFLFSCRNQRYIMRIPGEGTDLLIKRDEEAAVYDAIKDKDICDDIVYINPLNGYKITKYLESSRVCDSDNEEDLVRCMKKLRDFHSLNLKVGHKFDIFKQIDFYESLWDGAPSAYRDYNGTKIKVFELKEYIDNCKTEMCLTHIDAVPDNFLFTADGDIRLIDWEYAGMQDPHVDIAMFCIYALYDRSQVDRLIDIYFENNCEKQTRLKIYCYIAACGLLWSNWCEYKRSLGVEFGEYSLRQYRYAKEYYKIFKEEYDA